MGRLGADEVLGDPLSPVRFARVETTESTELWIVERHGARGFELPDFDPERDIDAARVFESFRRRRRKFPSDAEGFAHTRGLVEQAVEQVGPDRASDAFFTAEREYWQRRNRAARVQKARQDRLGMGWANHDHHTFRSSRENFAALIAIFETLGFELRERFWAGAEAGWGAQVLEQPSARIVIFADVDLSPEEISEDFAHDPLPPRKELGTVGLWCALHGDSLLEAGMHHLECQFDFDLLREQLERNHAVKTMKPFTDFPYLRQAFTTGERWNVEESRLDRLVTSGRLSPEDAEIFRREGAVGSHLENLERNQGYKGFNQTGVSEIIRATDPRRQNDSSTGR